MNKKKNKSQNEGLVNCLGWCNKKFLSEDKFTIRFCKTCTAKKEQIVRSSSGIRTANILTD